ncbi:recombinase [Virgibacillus halodenitrificans]|uniref:recombinase RecT n=1 Tax=Virgibacillus halodenitrificans TaxID=1482 RepID=UPI00136FE8FB|nr:recombinase RecT [Virgibacillus halodenitrificans]MCJ0932955.1 recombinase RecT [Virgibacillus halodenitrificans]MYL44620.1 recombinase [Virgibacillus halodenitrificans]
MSNNNQLALIKKDTVDVVAGKVKEFQEQGDLHFPANYSPENAMKSAWLILQETKDKNYKPALETCTRDSVANALLDMVVQGLNPQKKQGYFIVYGQNLTFQRSYFGTMAVTKRVTGAKEINANVIYEGDDVDYEMTNGKVTNLTHKQKFGNINKENIIGAYATIVKADDSTYHELMTMDEIRQAWSQSKMWGKEQKQEKKGSTHDNFKQEMAKKTVINRACKRFLNSSDDSSLVMQHFNRQDDAIEEAKARQEINENANKEELDFEPNVDPETGEIEDAEFQEIHEDQQSSVDQVMNDMEQKEPVAAGNEGPGF